MRPAKNLPLMRALAAELKAQRQRLDINQEELAHRSGLSRTFIGRVEIAANQPSLTALFLLAEACEVGAEELVAGIRARYRKELRAERGRGPATAN